MGYRVYDLFDVRLVKDAWRQRAEVGYLRARHFDYPVTIDSADVDGPNLYPGIAARANLYAPARVHIDAQNLSDLTIDTIGGVHSPAPPGEQRGFLPYDLLGGVGSAPSGGRAIVHAHMQFLNRPRANELFIPEQFGYHGWETETTATITLDGAAARKVLGISDAQFADFTEWWASHEHDVESSWRYWLFDEGGDAHVGGIGRLDTRVSAGGLPLQIWVNDLTLLDASPDHVTLAWDLVGEPVEQLWARWLREGVQSGLEPSSISDMTVDMSIGPDGTDLTADYAWDFALFKVRGTHRWQFESQLADVPDLTSQYQNESIYRSPGIPYAGAGGGPGGNDLDYVPGAFALQQGDTLTIDLRDPHARHRLGVGFARVEPPPSAFPGQVERVSGTYVRFQGPMDMASWSSESHPAAWRQLGGLLPWGEPYVTLHFVPDPTDRDRFADAPRVQPAPSVDPYSVIPPFPHPNLGPTPPLPETGRTVRYDFYNWLDVPMVADRWHQYEANDYARVQSLRAPVRYRTTPYFTVDLPAKPFSQIASGLRLRVTGRSLPEISMDTIGGGNRGAGFLPYDLMGGLGPAPPAGGHATFEGHLQYGTRKREAIYRQQQYWGYYGWENFLDARITLDGAAAQKVLGITGDQFAHFGRWWKAHEVAVETAWKQWLFSEFRRLKPMPFFNFPLEIWNLDLRLRPSPAGRAVLDLSVLDEALDLVYSRWFLETFMPHFEGSLSDMFLTIRIGPHGSDLDLDTATDWTLSGQNTGAGRTAWTFENYTGDNPFLAHEYRVTTSPALPYFGKAFRPGTPDAFEYTFTPTAFDLQAGEQLNFHWGGSGLRLLHVEPAPSDFPGQVLLGHGSLSLTGPLDLTRWSQAEYASDWAALGGLLPRGVPIVQLVG